MIDERDVDQLDGFLTYGTRHSYRAQALSDRMSRSRQRWGS